MAVTTISNLQNDLRFVLHLHREGQRSFAKRHAEPVKDAQPAKTKIVGIKA
jgi:hypothetical protein